MEDRRTCIRLWIRSGSVDRGILGMPGPCKCVTRLTCCVISGKWYGERRVMIVLRNIV